MNLELKFGNRVITSYKRMSYEAWYAFAEFVDNSTQAYFNNEKILDEVFEKEGTTLEVKIDYSFTNSENYIRIQDNSIGMNFEDLQHALTIGKPPEYTKGRSRYGMGMKTAAFWMGDNWTIETKKLGDDKLHKVSLSLENIIKEGPESIGHEIIKNQDIEKHGTTIEIRNLNRKFKTTKVARIKDFLKAMYRIDFDTYGLKLFWQGELLQWEGFKEKLHITKEGKRYYKEFNFEINGKKVEGWVGVLGRGQASRKNAGFSIIQANRVIQGWPDAFRPTTIFGDQEGGSNDLVNQRLVGELFLEDFEVSHTKDKIIWLDDELEVMEDQLEKICEDAVIAAKTVRFQEDLKKTGSEFVEEALNLIEYEVESDEIENYISTVHPPSKKMIDNSNLKLVERTVEKNQPSMSFIIGEGQNAITVILFFNEISPYEPYVIIETTPTENRVIVIINSLHPHFQEMNSSETVTNFIRHCVYDGVAEWKAQKLKRDLEPKTIKFIKDGLLRLEYQADHNI